MPATRTWRRRLRVIGAMGAMLLLLAAVAWWIAAGWRPSPDTFPIQGVDVSEAAGTIDWPVVRAAGADFAYVRASSGSNHRDTRFAGNWAGAHAAGMRRGAVHEFSLCQPAAAQAKLFIVTVPRVSDALPAAVAIGEREDCGTAPTAAVLIDELTRFAAMVETHTGEPLVMMISPAIEAKYDLARAFERPFWATGNYFPPTYLSRPWRMWRANARRRMDGVERAVGWNVVAP